MATTVPDTTPQPRAIWRYNNVAVALHWTMAALIVGQIGLGIYFHEMPPSPAKGELFTWHKTLGVTILALTLARIAWRLTHRPPPYPVEMPRWERVAGVWNHRIFYALMLALPVTGLLILSGGDRGETTELLGGITIPLVPGVPESVGEWAEQAHKLGAVLWIGLILLHVAAALKHQWWDKYETSGRMPPFVPPTERTE